MTLPEGLGEQESVARSTHSLQVLQTHPDTTGACRAHGPAVRATKGEHPRMKRTLKGMMIAAALLVGAPAAAQSTITFWHIYDSGDSLDFINEVVDRFNADNPDVIVQHLGTNFFDYWTRLTTAMAAGTGPDVSLNDLG